MNSTLCAKGQLFTQGDNYKISNHQNACLRRWTSDWLLKRPQEGGEATLIGSRVSTAKISSCIQILTQACTTHDFKISESPSSNAYSHNEKIYL